MIFVRLTSPEPCLLGGQNVALVQFDAFYSSDITNYEMVIGLTNSAPQLITVPVDGGVNSPGANGTEVSLDIEMVLSMAPGISNIIVYEAPNPSPWVDILTRIAMDDSASQISSSWLGGPPDPAAEQIFLQMALQGQTFFNASGDYDANTGLAQFPTASSGVTTVGGTHLTTDDGGNYLSESAWNRYDGHGSGGGTCPEYPIPGWQLGMDTSTNGASTIWRNVPDVALTADNVYVIFNGSGIDVGGTSCAAPLWAAFMALVNQHGTQLGQPPVGFFNAGSLAFAGAQTIPRFFTILSWVTIPVLAAQLTSMPSPGTTSAPAGVLPAAQILSMP